MKLRFQFIGVFLSILFLSSCGQKDPTVIDYAVAVIETTSNVSKSKITYYGIDLQEVYSEKLHYAELGDIFSDEVYMGNEVFIIPRGLMKQHDEHKVVGINQKTGKVTEYPIERNNIQAITVSKESIYAASNLNWVTYITQLNKKTSKIKEIELPNQYVGLMNNNAGYVYVFSENMDPNILNNKRHILVYNENLDLEKKIDITEIAPEISKCTVFENKLIFTINQDQEYMQFSKIGILDLSTYQLTQMDLTAHDAADVIPYKNKLIIANTSLIDPQGTKVSFINLGDKTSEVYDLGGEINRLAIKGDILYRLGKNDLAAYDLTNGCKEIYQTSGILSYGEYSSSLFVSDLGK